MSIIPQNQENRKIEVTLEELSPAAILAAAHMLYKTAEPTLDGQHTTPYSREAETAAADLLNQIASLLLEVEAVPQR